MAQLMMWVGLLVAGVTLVILLLSTTSTNLSLNFNTNLYHFLNNKGTESNCGPAKGKELCRKRSKDPAALAVDVEAAENVENTFASASEWGTEGTTNNFSTSSHEGSLSMPKGMLLFSWVCACVCVCGGGLTICKENF